MEAKEEGKKDALREAVSMEVCANEWVGADVEMIFSQMKPFFEPDLSAFEGKHSRVFRQGRGDDDFGSPWGVAISAQLDAIAVSEYSNHRVQLFSLQDSSQKLKLGSSAPSSGTGTGAFKYPEGIAIKDTDLWVCDTQNNRVEVFALGTGEHKRTVGAGQLSSPTELSIFQGHVYVCDRLNDRVAVFSASDGKIVYSFGKRGTGDGQLRNPTSCCIVEGDKDELFIADPRNTVVHCYSLTGYWKRSIGNHLFSSTSDLSLSAVCGQYWVTDSGLHHVQRFERHKDEVLSRFGGRGHDEGELLYPHCVCFYGNEAFTADGGNDRIEVFC